jgi:hypothetical protein
MTIVIIVIIITTVIVIIIPIMIIIIIIINLPANEKQQVKLHESTYETPVRSIPAAVLCTPSS